MADEEISAALETDTSQDISSVSVPEKTDAINLNDAFNQLSDRRNKEAAAERKAAGVPEPDNPPERADAAPETDPGADETESADPAEKPPVEPPRSWTKEEKEDFAKLSPETQQRIADREAKRETDFLRRQNEAVEQKKAAEAALTEAEKRQQAYEAKLPDLVAKIEYRLSEDFADIANWEDVRKMAREDPLRYSEWQAAQQQYEAVKAEAKIAQERATQRQHAEFASWAQDQEKIAFERIPDLKDPAKREATQRRAVETLKSAGFDEDTLARNWNGDEKLSLRDARWQVIIDKAARFDAAEKAAKTQAQKPVAPVQRPGVTVSKAEAASVDAKILSKQLDKTSNREDAFALLQAMRARR